MAKFPKGQFTLKSFAMKKMSSFKAFDCADGFASNAVRNVTTTPIQSLYL